MNDEIPSKPEGEGDPHEFERAAEQLEGPLASLVGDHEEEGAHAEMGTVRSRGIYLLPNLFTTGALFCGFYAVIAGMQGDFYSGAVAIFVAMLFDGLDGRVARLTKTTSAFGAEYDSLADMVSFGVAPALLMFNWALSGLDKLGWVAAFLYTACAALRLARFNTQPDDSGGNTFTGLASPAAAALVAGVVWLGDQQGIHPAGALGVAHAVLIACAGFLMVSRFPYFSGKSIRVEQRVPLARILLLIGLVALIALNPPLVLVCLFFVYAISGPVQYFRRSNDKAEIQTDTNDDSPALH